MKTVIKKYTKNDIDKLCKNLVLIIDTREKKNDHITKALDSNNIKYISKKLDFGDYSFIIKANDIIPEDIYFDDKIVIERKNSLEELSGNLSSKRTQFINELERKKDCKFMLLIEKGSYGDIFNANYKTQMSSKAYLASLMTFIFRYNIQIAFVGKENVHKYIVNLFYYYLRENFSK